MRNSLKESVKNNATSKIIGFDYQKLIALKKCFDARAGETIYIECLGDVACGNEAIEVKHHQGDHSLINTSIDFWKTLKNLVEEKEMFFQFNKLILYTTSKIKKGSIFDGWDKLSKQQKYQKVKAISPNQTIKPFYEQIFKDLKEDIELILDRLIIYSEMPKVKTLLNSLEEHPIFTAFEKKDRKRIIDELVGMLSRSAIENSNKWNIVKDDFDRDFRVIAQEYMVNGIMFPKVSKHEINIEESKEFLFINEIKKINYEKRIKEALLDFLRADKSAIELIKHSPIIYKKIKEFEEDLLEELERKKMGYSNRINKKILKTEEANNISRELYDSCLEIKKLEIPGIIHIKNYFQHGRIHSIIEEEEFKWEFIKEDL